MSDSTLHHPEPAGLAEAGSALWFDVASRYKMRPDERAVLEDACRTTDMVAALDDAWAEDGRPMTTKGSMGQLVTHPLISELRQHRTARAALLRQLKLPDLDEAGDESGARPNQHRSAAQTRWAKPRGA